MLIHSLELPGIPKAGSGKVREIFDLGDRLLLVATDRISAFDCILPDPIPGKGEVLNGLSAFWFEHLAFQRNHVITTDFVQFPAALQPFAEQLAGRSMVVQKAQPLPIECVVRGYLAGSGWKEYQASRSVCGIPVPAGLQLASPLPEALFTPSTKAASGHDVNIPFAEAERLLGSPLAHLVREQALRLYAAGAEYAEDRGVIVADTKFEFGLLGGELLLIDECLTPDSSRFWPASEYRAGLSPPSFDKQFVRDYLESLPWDKTPPAPALPPEVIQRTSEKYAEARQRLCAPVPD